MTNFTGQMKAFVFIFSIYLLAIAVLPCSDAENECRTETAASSFVQQHSHQTDHNDFCSPLCTCNCCNLTIEVKHAAVKVKNARVLSQKKLKYSLHTSPYVSGFYGNIWHPPKFRA